MSCRLTSEKKAVLTKNFLFQEYYCNKKSQQTIADENQISRETIRRYFKNFEMSSRSHKECTELRNLSGKNNPMYSHGKCIKASKCKFCGKQLVAFSATMCKSCANSGKRNPRYGKRASHGKWTQYKDVNFRSSWEAKFAKYLDKENIKWFYEYTTFYGENYSYTPDFYLSETNEYVEIKGWWREKSLEKVQKFIIDFPNVILSVRGKDTLKRLGVL